MKRIPWIHYLHLTIIGILPKFPPTPEQLKLDTIALTAELTFVISIYIFGHLGKEVRKIVTIQPYAI